MEKASPEKSRKKRLDEVHITVNKNTIPFDTNSPFVASGVRIGTPALTTRGMKEDEMRKIGALDCRDYPRTGIGRSESESQNVRF